MRKVSLTQTQASRAKFYAKETVLPNKNAKYDFHGVSPLKDKDSGTTFFFKIKIKLFCLIKIISNFSLYFRPSHLSDPANYA